LYRCGTHAILADGATGQIVGNLLVFAALGFLAPLRFAALTSVLRILALAAGCSILLESAQYSIDPGTGLRHLAHGSGAV
jgi:glycopeptide antibiotics resistance protein